VDKELLITIVMLMIVTDFHKWMARITTPRFSVSYTLNLTDIVYMYNLPATKSNSFFHLARNVPWRDGMDRSDVFQANQTLSRHSSWCLCRQKPSICPLFYQSCPTDPLPTAIAGKGPGDIIATALDFVCIPCLQCVQLK